MQLMWAYFLKMGLCSAILLGYYWVALRNERFHQWNRFYLLAAMLLSVIIPFFNFPIIAKEEPVGVVYVIAALPWNSVTAETSFWTWTSVWKVLAVIVSAIMLLHLLVSIAKIIYMYRRHQHSALQDVKLVITEEQTAPFSFFKWLFWRSDIDPDSDNGKRMLQHELTHISEKHSADKLFVELLLIVFWMNPFFWIMRRELFAIHEFLADQKAIAKQDGAAFAAMILQAVHPARTPALGNPFFSSQLKRRLVMITTSSAPKYSYLRRVSGLALMIITTFILIVTIEKVNAQKPPAVPKAPPPAPTAKQAAAPAVEALPDSIQSVQITDNHGTCMVTYKMKDGRKVIMQLSEVEKKGYPFIVPSPPPPVPGVAPVPAVSSVAPSAPAKPSAAVPGVAPVAPVAPVKPVKPVHSLDHEWENATKVNGMQVTQGSGDIKTLLHPATPNAAGDPLIIYAGLEISSEQMGKIDSRNIQSVNVLKGEQALKSYGEKGRNGVVLITPKSIQSSVKERPVQTRESLNEVTVVGYGTKKGTPIYYVDGKKISEQEMKAILPENIESINVLKGAAAVEKFGEEAKDGVIIITTKKNAPGKVISDVETMPSFPGGTSGWRTYLSQTLKYPEKAQNEGTQGVAVVKFVVEPTGDLSNISIVKDPGNGLGDEAVRLLKKGPKWNPAMKDGCVVKAEVNQTITFRLE